LNLRNDIAAPLGGEYAFAIDGPILPVPSWKLVFQVNDPPVYSKRLNAWLTK
jgi:hypothetical protein